MLFFLIYEKLQPNDTQFSTEQFLLKKFEFFEVYRDNYVTRRDEAVKFHLFLFYFILVYS